MAPPPTAPDVGATVDTLVTAMASQPPISFTYEQCIAGAILGGFSPADAVTITAIGSVETSRNAIAISGKVDAAGDRRYGAFAAQLDPHMAIKGQWVSPQGSAQYAAQEHLSGGWHGWPSYASGAYLAAMSQATMAGAAVQAKIAGQGADAQAATLNQIAMPKDLGGQVVQAWGLWVTGASVGPAVNTGENAIGSVGAAGADATVQGVFKPFGSVLDFLNALGNPHTWVRLVYVLLGGALVIVALRQVAIPEIGGIHVP